MVDASTSWNLNKGSGPIDPNEKLFLFGYSCKIFPYDEKAAYIDKGNHLIPWMGDKAIMIDRYDVRGYLHDLKQYEPGNHEESSDEEKLIDEERYRSLRTDMTEEQLYQEEELKRLRAAIAGDGAYHEIGFTYDNTENEKEPNPVSTKVEDPEDDLYQAPESLKIPKDMEVPYNMKIHAIIEKTATFISEQGGQMEIIIKMKQHANPQFAFMHLDNPLHPYYKHLVKEIKAGTYKPIQTRKVSRSEDEDDDGHYLHPSLMAGKANSVPKFTVPTINFRRSHDDSYSLLVRNLQQHLVEETTSQPADPEVFEPALNEGSANDLPAEYYNEDGTYNDYVNNFMYHNHAIVPPPPDSQPIVDKMAEYVAKNGEDFETIVKSKKDTRFDFLHPWHEYYNYYIYKRDHAKFHMFGNGTVPSAHPSSAQLSPNRENEIPFISSEGAVPENSGVSQPDADAENKNSDSVNDEYDALYSQDSQGVEETQDLKDTTQDSSDSMDFLNSPSDKKEEAKAPITKVIKGPISFSLKVKECEASSDKAKLTPLLLDDTDEESNEESQGHKECSKQRNFADESSANHATKVTGTEVKAQKPVNEALEAKLAEERIKDKLLATARERLAQQRKEKQQLLEQQQRAEQQKIDKQLFLDQQRKEKELQLERKRKAALFLKMLKRRSPDSTTSAPAPAKGVKKREEGKTSRHSPDFWSLPDTSDVTSPDSGILFPLDKIIMSTNVGSSAIPGIKTNWSPDPHSEESATEDPSSRISDKQSSDSDTTHAKQERRKKRRRRSRSRSRDRSRMDRLLKSSYRSKDKRRSRTLPRPYKSERSKREKEKQLPAAYAIVNRSRSRSRSPRRYRGIPSWRRR